MRTGVEVRIGEVEKMKRYEIRYPITAYTFPSDARIHDVRIDEEYIHVELMDGRILSIPLWWIPTVYNARPEEREKYEISRDRRMVIWDPERCEINDELRIADYLVTEKKGLTPRAADAAAPRANVGEISA